MQPSICVLVGIAWSPLGYGWLKSASIALAQEQHQTDRWSSQPPANAPDDSSDDPYVRVTLELRQSTLVWLDDLRKEWGLRSRRDLLSRLLDELAKPTSDA
jgi:hypothetical protein